MDVAHVVATRATCPRASVGAVIVQPVSNQILATGYNGAPSGSLHCLDAGCDVRKTARAENGVHGLIFEEHCIRTVHAEINAICSAARNGARLDRSIIWITHSPCINCTMALRNAGIGAIRYAKPYKVEALQEWISKNLPYGEMPIEQIV